MLPPLKVGVLYYDTKHPLLSCQSRGASRGDRYLSQSRGQVLGYDGCYDSGTCHYDYFKLFPVFLPIIVVVVLGEDNNGCGV